LLAVTIVVYLLQMASKQLYGEDVVAMMGMKSNAAIEAGQWWRLITPMFLHGGIFHIGFNMYALYVLGPSLERFLREARALARLRHPNIIELQAIHLDESGLKAFFPAWAGFFFRTVG
jgi:membrane associated rhomboid family serine protease